MDIQSSILAGDKELDRKGEKSSFYEKGTNFELAKVLISLGKRSLYCLADENGNPKKCDLGYVYSKDNTGIWVAKDNLSEVLWFEADENGELKVYEIGGNRLYAKKKELNSVLLVDVDRNEIGWFELDEKGELKTYKFGGRKYYVKRIPKNTMVFGAAYNSGALSILNINKIGKPVSVEMTGAKLKVDNSTGIQTKILEDEKGEQIGSLILENGEIDGKVYMLFFNNWHYPVANFDYSNKVWLVFENLINFGWVDLDENGRLKTSNLGGKQVLLRKVKYDIVIPHYGISSVDITLFFDDGGRRLN